MSRPLMLMPIILAFAACAPTASKELKVADGWARATPSGQTMGAVYLVVDNGGGQADRLVEATTDRATTAMIHQNDSAGGVARMRMTEELDIPAGARIELHPGGTHIMLGGLSAPLRTGDRFSVTLHFARAGERTVPISVVAPGSR